MTANDSVAVTPRFLLRLIRSAACAVPGVIRLTAVPAGHPRRTWDGGAGVALSTDAGGLSIDCFLVASSRASLPELGLAVQLAVANVIRDQIGAAVREVNVFIQNVADPTPAGEPIAHG